MMAGQLKDEVLLQLMEDVVDKEIVQTGLEVSYRQGCGSALIVCGSGSTKFSECGSVSRTKNHQIFQKVKNTFNFQFRT